MTDTDEREPVYRNSGDDRPQLRELVPEWFRELQEQHERLERDERDDG